MALEWLKRFQASQEKPPGYAEKTLAAYALGMKAGGAIEGVTVEVGPEACAAALALPPGAVYRPEEAPRLPLPGCPRAGRCSCVYRPAMRYARRGEP
ncbi:hypothetical protein [Anaeromyxobacter paludicola]|uniref:Uncharacterized protein n=1 Tax=Anaeromyxobacter paludicola TaxID=2918171 RepID=A0ABM7X6J1_9BACT|nr:hypothetical protein [Anaeromyxobacter paludicola]BDG07433.1 hypothetical protein AMPC_05460 [Anaeromyxobacter paludicola]